MAKKKRKGSRKGRRSGRRVSGMKVHPAVKTTLMAAAGAAAGGLLGVFGNQALKTGFPTMPPWAGGAGLVAAGVALPLFLTPSPFIWGAAAGLAATGAIFAANESFISLPGISGMPMAQYRPGYINQTVGRPPHRMPRARMGNLSGNNQTVVGAIYDN